MGRQQKLYTYNPQREAYISRVNVEGKVKTITLCSRVNAEYDGKRKRSAQQLDRYLVALRETKLNELQPEISSYKISTVFDEWMEEVLAVRRFRTFQDYRITIKHYLKAVGDHELSQISNMPLNRLLLNYFTKVGNNPRTQKKHLTTLSTAFKWMVEMKYLDHPPKLNIPTVTKKRHGTYSEDEIHRIFIHIWLKYAEGEIHYRTNYWMHMRLFMLFLYTGMRRKEVWTLKLKNIFLTERSIHIEDCPELDFVVKGRRDRKVPISEKLAEFLVNDLQHRDPEEIWYLDKGNGKNFYSHPDMLTHVFTRACRELGIEGVKALHGFRSTLLTKLAKKNVAIAQKVAGHTDIQTTMIYVDDSLLEAKEALDGI